MDGRLKSGLVGILVAGSLFSSSCGKNDTDFRIANNNDRTQRTEEKRISKNSNVVYIDAGASGTFVEDDGRNLFFVFGREHKAFSNSFISKGDSYGYLDESTYNREPFYMSILTEIFGANKNEVDVNASKFYMAVSDKSAPLSIKASRFRSNFSEIDGEDRSRILKIIKNSPSLHKDEFGSNSKIFCSDARDGGKIEFVTYLGSGVNTELFLLNYGMKYGPIKNKDIGIYMAAIGEFEFTDKKSNKKEKKTICHIYEHRRPFITGFDGYWEVPSERDFIFTISDDRRMLGVEYVNAFITGKWDDSLSDAVADRNKNRFLLEGTKDGKIIEVHKGKNPQLIYIHNGIKEPLKRTDKDWRSKRPYFK